MSRKNSSLSLRITLLTGMAMAVIICGAGLAILVAFKNFQSRSLDSYLGAYIDIAVAATRIDDAGQVSFSRSLHILDDLPYYWQINVGGVPVKKSDLLSTYLAKQPNTQVGQGGQVARLEFTIDDDKIIAISKSLYFPGNKEVTYIFGVNSKIASAYLENASHNFYQSLVVTFTLITALAILIIIFQVRLSLKPLQAIKANILEVRQKHKAKLNDNFVREIQPLADEVNRLIEYNNNIIERYRVFAANIAHALKTPITVMRNEAQVSKGTLSKVVIDKTNLLLALIERNLSRLRISGSANVWGHKVNMRIIIANIITNFNKLYRREVNFICDDKIEFAGEEGDLYEMLGNLIENGLKYSKHKLLVSAFMTEELLTIIIEDDGPGISDENKVLVLERGTRLDEKIAGHGIGLGIAFDIAKIYGGDLSLQDSADLGGLKLVVTLPVG